MTFELNALTVRAAFEFYRKRSPWGRDRVLSETTVSHTEYLLRHYASAFWDRPIASITARECEHLFAHLTTIGPAAANKTLGCLGTVINVARAFCERDDGADAFPDGNPVSRMRRLIPPNPIYARSGCIPAARVRAVWQSLKALGERAATPSARTGADWLRFRLMTGMQIRLSRELRFSHVDWERQQIRVPHTLTKNYRDFSLPMPPQLRELLEHRQALHLAQYPLPELAPDAYIFASAQSACGHISCARVTLKATAGTEIAESDIRRTFDAIAHACGIREDVRRRLLGLAPENLHFATFDGEGTDKELLSALNAVVQWLDRPEVRALSSEMLDLSPSRFLH